MLFNQNIVWGLLTKFCTKIDSYKKDVYGTTGISNLSVIFKMATKTLKNDLARISAKIDIQGKHDDEFIYDLKNNHWTAFSERSRS